MINLFLISVWLSLFSKLSPSKDSDSSSKILNTLSAPVKAVKIDEYNCAISLIGLVNCLVVVKNIINTAIVKGSPNKLLPIPFKINNDPNKHTKKYPILPIKFITGPIDPPMI